MKHADAANLVRKIFPQEGAKSGGSGSYKEGSRFSRGPKSGYAEARCRRVTITLPDGFPTTCPALPDRPLPSAVASATPDTPRLFSATGAVFLSRVHSGGERGHMLHRRESYELRRHPEASTKRCLAAVAVGSLVGWETWATPRNKPIRPLPPSEPPGQVGQRTRFAEPQCCRNGPPRPLPVRNPEEPAEGGVSPWGGAPVCGSRPSPCSTPRRSSFWHPASVESSHGQP